MGTAGVGVVRESISRRAGIIRALYLGTLIGWAACSPQDEPRGLEQYHHERRQPGDKIARSNKELERFRHRFFIPVTLKTL